jgi:hypothetical protein
MSKLNMWQRLGIVASVLWIIGGGFWQRTADVHRASEFSEMNYTFCTEMISKHGDYNFKSCSEDAGREFKLALVGSWGNVAIFAFGPVLLAWLLAWVSVRVGRWVLAGRKQ